jgi:NtrC-family two-component system sensor histidine kinase KinB
MPENETRSSLELLYNISRELASALDLRTVLTRVVLQSLKYVGGERGSLVVFDEQGKPKDSAIVIGIKVHDQKTQQLRETTERGLAGWVVRNRKSAWIPDTSKDERWLRRPDDAADKSGPKSALCVPLVVRDQLVGVLTLVHPTPGAFHQDHFDLVQVIADQAAIAILNARLYAESQRQARIMTALVESAATINASLRLDDVLERILKEAIHAMQVETVALALIEPSGDLVFRDATSQEDLSQNIIGRHIPSGTGLASVVVLEGKGVVLSDVTEDARFDPKYEQFSDSTIQALTYEPIFSQGRVIGLLAAVNPLSGTFDLDALPVLAGIGNLAGSAIQNAQLYELLQAAHQHYRELFDDSIDPILITDWNGKIAEANRQAAILSGFTQGQLHDMNIAELHKPDLEKLGLNFDVLKNGLTSEYESNLQGRNGLEIPVQVYARKVKFDETEMFQWILRDIKARKELDALRDDLTSMIFHDVRSPLANIVSSLDLMTAMLGESKDESLDSVLKIAKRSTARIQRLINSLLDINRLESGKTIGLQQVIHLPVLVDEVVDTVQTMTEVRRQSLTVELQAEMPPLWVDVDMIRRVLVNLAENASKFTLPEGKLVIGAKQEGDQAKIWVQDNGPGIPLADQERVFDKYTRLRGEQSTSGLGVGLAFCRLAILAHGGKIWVESEPGHGACFFLTLPLAKEQPQVLPKEN